MFAKILIVASLSDLFERVLSTLGELKLLGTREVLLVHCLNIRDLGSLADRLMELAKPALEKQKKILEDLGFQTEARMVLGLPQIEINQIAVDSQCSMIVVAEEEHTLVGEAVLGGTATGVIHTATRSVMILRLKTKHEIGRPVIEEAPCNPLAHILFPTDFSDNAEHAFSYVRKIAECGAKRITLLHVQDHGRIDKHLKHKLEEFNEIDMSRLTRLKANLENLGVKDVRIDLLYGSPKKEILARIRQHDVSLVVMGSQERGFIHEVFLGSVSHVVARHADAPVLLIPAVR